ncbi:MAG TPA: 4'-phosphopantetheinyl transferase superfamily protein [Rhodanobacteraceae bacterium]|nr:4'-phosphopantetheinyl transferase superfamily protein [Rhodanobacteraceae bacterium]
MIRADAFVEAEPREAAPRLGRAIHLWRLPWRREHGRAPLLGLLAAYVGADVSTLQLEEDAHGKPRLRSPHALHFNWSHSGDFAVVAFSRDFEIGVDIEQPRAGVRILELADRFFSPGEARALAECAEADREAAFFQLWSAKEATLKALGRGLAFGLERVEFARSGRGWRPQWFEAEAGAAADWQVLPVIPAPGYAGALAWRGPARPTFAGSLVALG